MAEQIFLFPRKGVHNAVLREGINVEVVGASSQKCFVLGVEDLESAHFFCEPFSIKLPFGEDEALFLGVVHDLFNILFGCSMMLMQKLQ